MFNSQSQEFRNISCMWTKGNGSLFAQEIYCLFPVSGHDALLITLYILHSCIKD